MSWLFDFVRKRRIASDWSVFLDQWVMVTAQNGMVVYGHMVRANPDGILLRPVMTGLPKAGDIPGEYRIEDRPMWIYGWHLGGILAIDQPEFLRRWEALNARERDLQTAEKRPGGYA